MATSRAPPNAIALDEVFDSVRGLGRAVHAAVPGAIGGLCVLQASDLLRLTSAFSQSCAGSALAVPAASWPPPPSCEWLLPQRRAPGTCDNARRAPHGAPLGHG